MSHRLLNLGEAERASHHGMAALRVSLFILFLISNKVAYMVLRRLVVGL